MVVPYAIAGWIVIEVASTVLPSLNLPDWTTTLVIVLVALGFIVAVMLAWAFDLGPKGIERTPPDGAPAQGASAGETTGTRPVPAVTAGSDSVFSGAPERTARPALKFP